MAPIPENPARTPVGLFRRFAAGFYDGLLLLALALVSVACVLALSGGFSRPAGVLRKASAAETAANLLAITCCTVFYFGHGWRKAGQSLGMKAWKIRLEREDGKLPTWRDTARRLACAAPFYLTLLVAVLALMLQRPVVAAVMALPLAANVGWMLWRRDGALHDRWSRTRVVRGE